MRLDFSPWGVQAAMHLAQNKGWFKEAKLDVDIQDGRGSGNTIQLVNAGQADVGQVQVGLVGSARAKGATIRSIATFQRKTDLCILVDKESPMAKVADLRGKTVVVFAASPWAPFIDTYLKSGGLTRDDLKVDVVDPAALWGTYIAKRADGLMSTVGSALPIAEEPRPSKCLLASDADITFPSYGLVARDETIASKGPALKRLIEVAAARLAASAHQPGRRRQGDDRRASRCAARSGGAAQPDQADAGLLRYAGFERQADRLAGQGRLGSGAQVDGSRRCRRGRLESRRLLHQRACRVT